MVGLIVPTMYIGKTVKRNVGQKGLFTEQFVQDVLMLNTVMKVRPVELY